MSKKGNQNVQFNKKNFIYSRYWNRHWDENKRTYTYICISPGNQKLEMTLGTGS